MSPYLVLLILEFLSARLAMLPYGLDSNVTELLANLLTKPSVFYYLSIVSCNLLSIKLLLLYYKSVFNKNQIADYIVNISGSTMSPCSVSYFFGVRQ